MPVGYVRDATADDRWAASRLDMISPGYRVVLVDDFARPRSDWAPIQRPTSMRCRYTVGPGHRTCKRDAVAQLCRGAGRYKGGVWRGYCERHLYGRRLDNGRLLNPILIKDESDAGAG
jgi:hypothetical protein